MSRSEQPPEFDEVLYSIVSGAGPAGVATRTKDCPDESAWFEVAAGSALPESEGVLLDHAVNCAHCASMLKRAIEDFHGETTVAEQRFIDDVFNVRGPIRLVSDGAHPLPVGKTPPRARSSLRRWAIAAGLVAAIALGGWKVAFPIWASHRAQTLLAASEASGRLSEFRLSNAPWAPVRGLRAGRLEPSADILEAEDWARHAKDDAANRLTRARIVLASGEDRDVSGLIEDAMSHTGRTPALLNDLGVALAAVSTAKRDSVAAVRALAALDEALNLQPAFAPALFNRAILLDEMNRHSDACRAVDVFLSAESDPRWRQDLRARVGCPG